MRRALSLHPDSICPPVTGITAEVSRSRRGGLNLAYRVSGEVGALRLPAVAAPTRTDGLWRRTCFEAFVQPADADAYLELNFAPSTEWAAYCFTGYRTGMEMAREIARPRIEVETGPASCEVLITLELGQILPGATAWRLGLSAVIEEAEGRISYWAMAHPPGKPDFHHSRAFALNVLPGDR